MNSSITVAAMTALRVSVKTNPAKAKTRKGAIAPSCLLVVA